MTQGERRDQHRGWELRNKEVLARHLGDDVVDDTHLNPTIFGSSGQITTIDPDDTVAAGATGKVADAGHQHAFTSGAPSALTRTATNTEGSSSSHARADHGHSTAAVAWGTLASQILTTNSSTFSGADATTDFALASVAVLSTRDYAVTLFSQYNTAGACSWVVNFHVDATLTDRFYFINPGAATRSAIWARMLWKPTSGTKSLDVRVDWQSGSDLQFEAASGNSRQFFVEDVGART